jgi:hypothetical protein
MEYLSRGRQASAKCLPADQRSAEGPNIYGTSRDKIRSITSAPVVMTGRSSWR